MVGGALELGDVVGSVLAQDSDARGGRLGGLAGNGSLETPITTGMRYVPVELGVSRAACGSGRGSEKRREDCSRRAVGELYALDMVAALPGGCDVVV